MNQQLWQAATTLVHVLLLGAACEARQISIGPAERLDTGLVGASYETAIAVNPLNRAQAFAAYIDDSGPIGPFPPARLRIAARPSTGPADAWPHLPLPGLGSADRPQIDPTVVWHGGISAFLVAGLGIDDTGTHVWCARFTPGGTDATHYVNVSAGSLFGVDKPMLAVGPRPGDPSALVVYAAWTRIIGTSGPAINEIHLARSFDAGLTWERANGSSFDTGLRGIGVYPLVLPSGRLLLMYWGPPIEPLCDDGLRKRDEIRVSYSTSSMGATWQGTTTLPRFAWACGSTLPSDTRIGPSFNLALDPTSGKVYAIYHSLKHMGGGTYSASDIDVRLARSTDNGASFQEWVVIPQPGGSESDQFLPAVAVDGCGQVNALWYDTRNVPQSDSDADLWLDVYYARIRGDDAPAVAPIALTDQLFKALHENNFSGSFGVHHVGDYQQIAASGNRIYPAYMVVTNGDALPPCPCAPRGHIYSRQIRVLLCDLGGNSAVADDDLDLFAEAFERGDAAADFDGDGSVSVDDAAGFVDAFVEEYGAHCGGG